MFLGVPYIPFVFGAGACLLITFYVNMYYIVLLPVVIFIMRQMARRDEMIFRLLGLRLQFRVRVRNLQQHQGMWVFTPNYYRNPGDKKS
jgi:type IV secretion system protein VirB3